MRSQCLKVRNTSSIESGHHGPIAYDDVEVGGAIQMKELPFVVGILANLAGQQDALPRLKERKFTESIATTLIRFLRIWLHGSSTRLPILPKPGEQLGVDLTFRHLDDFHPTTVVKAVPQLRAMLEIVSAWWTCSPSWMATRTCRVLSRSCLATKISSLQPKHWLPRARRRLSN